MARKSRKPPFAGPYETMEFPDYEFTPYPKKVTVKRDGVEQRIRVFSLEEERLVLHEVVPEKNLKAVEDKLVDAQANLGAEVARRKSLEDQVAELGKQLLEMKQQQVATPSPVESTKEPESTSSGETKPEPEPSAAKALSALAGKK